MGSDEMQDVPYRTQTFQVITNHNPLKTIPNSHCLDGIENPRLQHLNHRLMAYSFQISVAQRNK